MEGGGWRARRPAPVGGRQPRQHVHGRRVIEAELEEGRCRVEAELDEGRRRVIEGFEAELDEGGDVPKDQPGTHEHPRRRSPRWTSVSPSTRGAPGGGRSTEGEENAARGRTGWRMEQVAVAGEEEAADGAAGR